MRQALGEDKRAKLENGSYKPVAGASRGRSPKTEGAGVTLGIPTVLDRLIQQAIAQVLTPLL